ncbi:MAG: gpW family head-tail joining protein [Pseudomonadota bacterium]
MTLTEQLEDARKQLHLLLTGQAATVFVDQSGERVEFRPATASRLAAYVRDLERQLAGHGRPARVNTTSSKGLT